MKTCWVVTNGTAGTISQSLGLAQRLGFKNIIQKVFNVKFSLAFIPVVAHVFLKNFLSDDSDKLEGPWPDILIACGRRVIPVLLYIKKASKGKTYCIYVQDPRISAKYFDLIIKMQHDLIKGENVISTDFSLNLINKESLFKEAKMHKDKFKGSIAPYYTILIGGNTKRYTMNSKAAKSLIDNIRRIITLCPGSLLISTSRRTPDSVTIPLMSEFRSNKKIHIITPHRKGENLYSAMLGLAEKIFVTNDSVNMISEACATEKPVYIIPLLNMFFGKTQRFFLDRLLKNNSVKIFNGELVEAAKVAKVNNNELIADKVRSKLIELNICSTKDFYYK